MKHLFTYNHSPALRLEPESEVEILILKEMVEKAAQGAQATLRLEGQNQFVLTVVPRTKE
jgi:hypothetical protein